MKTKIISTANNRDILVGESEQTQLGFNRNNFLTKSLLRELMNPALKLRVIHYINSSSSKSNFQFQ